MIVRESPIIIDYYNGTYDTLQCIYNKSMITKEEYLSSDLFKYVISKMIDYYETPNYVFTHGFIPASKDENGYHYNKNWRNSSLDEWMEARWINGMEYAESIIEDISDLNKKIVVGHYETGFGHRMYENDFTRNYNIYYGKNVIALDATTVLSHKVNILVLDENKL